VFVPGDKAIETPLLTAIFPGFTTPLPFAKTAVSDVDVPEVIVAGLAVKLVITGAGTTVTLVAALAVVPTEFVTVRV
jgi:hypothetical protein